MPDKCIVAMVKPDLTDKVVDAAKAVGATQTRLERWSSQSSRSGRRSLSGSAASAAALATSGPSFAAGASASSRCGGGNTTARCARGARGASAREVRFRILPPGIREVRPPGSNFGFITYVVEAYGCHFRLL